MRKRRQTEKRLQLPRRGDFRYMINVLFQCVSFGFLGFVFTIMCHREEQWCCGSRTILISIHIFVDKHAACMFGLYLYVTTL